MCSAWILTFVKLRITCTMVMLLKFKESQIYFNQLTSRFFINRTLMQQIKIKHRALNPGGSGVTTSILFYFIS